MRNTRFFKPAATVCLSVASATLGPVPGQAQPWQKVQPLTRVERVVKIDALPPVGITSDVETKLTAALEIARAGGKYRTLLAQIARPDDAGDYGPFNDHGLVEEVGWRGIKGAPGGYWVYAHPYWYVWRDLASQPRLSRSWGTEQATGAPDTEEAGDQPTAWASRTPDGQPEWLELEYAQPIAPSGIKIYESYNPGAVTRVTGFTMDGQEVELWKGDDPTRDVTVIGVLSLQFRAGFKINRVKVYIDSPAVPGWNEIDAVGLIDAAGKPHWATAATASSCYAEQTTNNRLIEIEQVGLERRARIKDGLLVAPVADPAPPGYIAAPTDADRIAALEAEVATLKVEVEKLREALHAQQGQAAPPK